MMSHGYTQACRKHDTWEGGTDSHVKLQKNICLLPVVEPRQCRLWTPDPLAILGKEVLAGDAVLHHTQNRSVRNNVGHQTSTKHT